MKKYLYSTALVLLLSVFIASPVFAGATLHIGFGAGTECATGCGGDPMRGPRPAGAGNQPLRKWLLSDAHPSTR